MNRIVEVIAFFQFSTLSCMVGLIFM